MNDFWAVTFILWGGGGKGYTNSTVFKNALTLSSDVVLVVNSPDLANTTKYVELLYLDKFNEKPR